MAVTLVATVGSASANSYVSQAEATAYLEGRLNSTAWSGASTGDKDIALVEAFRTMNTLVYVGTKATSTQAAQWPRYDATDPDAAWPASTYFDSSTIPQRVKDAQCELALEFLRAGTTDIASLDPQQGLIAKRIDVLEWQWQPGARPASGIGRYPRVLDLLQPLFATSGARVIRG